jgi:hypothetical protein
MRSLLLAVVFALSACDDTVAPTWAPPPGGALDAPSVICGSSTDIRVSSGRPSPTDSSWRVRSIAPSSVFAVVGPHEGVISAGDSAAITVRATAAGGLAPGVPVRGFIELEVGDQTQVHPLQITPIGSYVRSSHATLDFGVAPLTYGKREQAVTLTNDGDEAASVLFAGGGAPFSFQRVVTVRPHASEVVPIRFDPNESALVEQKLLLTDTTQPCAQPVELRLRGEASGSTFGVGTSTLDFGATACNESAPAKSVELRNHGTTPLDWKATLGRGVDSPYVIEAGSEGLLLPGETWRVHIRARAVTDAFAHDLDDDITFASGAGARRVILTQRVAGASLEGQARVEFPRTRLFQSSAPVDVEVTNAGTAQVDVMSAGSEFVMASTVTLPPGKKEKLPIAFVPQDIGVREQPLQLTTTPRSCGPLDVTVAGESYTRATSMSASTIQECFIVDGGRIACLTGGTDVPPKLFGTGTGTAVSTFDFPTLVCTTQSTGGRPCWEYDSAQPSPPQPQGELHTGRSVVDPFLLHDDGKVTQLLPYGARWDSGQALAIAPVRSLRAYRQGNRVIAVFQDGHVETWEREVASSVAGTYPKGRNPWPNITAAVDAANSSGYACALHANGTVTCLDAGVVKGLNDATALAASGWPYTACAIRAASQSVVCWGTGDHLTELGGGTDSLQPIAIGINGAVEIGSSFDGQYYARLSDGRVMGWRTHWRTSTGSWVQSIRGLD